MGEILHLSREDFVRLAAERGIPYSDLSNRAATTGYPLARSLIASRRPLGGPPGDAEPDHGRQAFARVVAQAGGAPPVRLAPRDQLVNTLEYEEQARRVVSPTVASLIADKVDRATGVSVDRQAFDRITLRPRMLVPTLDLDLTVTLFGEAVFAPIVVAPIADQKRFHPAE